MDQSEEDRKRRSVADQPTVTSGSAPVPPPVPPAPGVPPSAPGSGYGSPSPYGSTSPYGSSSPYGHGPGPGQGPGPVQGYGPGNGPVQQGHPPYGHPPPGPQPFAYGPGPGPGFGWHGTPPPAGKPVAAMVIGIIGLVAVTTCWGSFLAIFLSPLALGLGLSARRAADRGETSGRGQAVAGFVLGIVGTVLSVLCVAFLVVMLVFFREELDRGPGSGGGEDEPSLDARRATAALVLPGAANAADREV